MHCHPYWVIQIMCHALPSLLGNPDYVLYALPSLWQSVLCSMCFFFCPGFTLYSLDQGCTSVQPWHISKPQFVNLQTQICSVMWFKNSVPRTSLALSPLMTCPTVNKFELSVIRGLYRFPLGFRYYKMFTHKKKLLYLHRHLLILTYPCKLYLYPLCSKYHELKEMLNDFFNKNI